MRIIIVKETPKPYSNRTFKVGQNITVTADYGRELVKKKRAVEIPQFVNGVWHLQGRPTQKMKKLWLPRPVTIEDLKLIKEE